MRTMKEKERLLLIAKVYLDLKGPSTAKEITDYINFDCPVGFSKYVVSKTIANLLKGHNGFKVIRGHPNIYDLK